MELVEEVDCNDAPDGVDEEPEDWLEEEAPALEDAAVDDSVLMLSASSSESKLEDEWADAALAAALVDAAAGEVIVVLCVTTPPLTRVIEVEVAFELVLED